MKEIIGISFEDEQLKKLREESKHTGNSIAAIVRLAVNDYFLKGGI